MKEIHDLWEIRAKDYWNQAIRYLRLIGNSGFLFTIYLLIIIGGYYYSLFLEWLPESFPVPVALALLVGFYLTNSQVRTFVKEGDLVFLLPLETKLNNYFRRSLVYSYIFQAFTLLLGAVVLGPLYTTRITEDRSLYFTAIITLLLVKGWNMFNSWNEQRLPSEFERNWHGLLRFIINVSFAYMLFVLAPIVYLAAIGVIMLGLSFFYYRHLEKKHSLKWERLLEVEDKQQTMFYRIANLFTDVPKLKVKVKQRRWLADLANAFVPKAKTRPFVYLYMKSFIRSSDYLGVYLRLFVIAFVLLSVLPEGLIRQLTFLLFLYMSGLQLSTLWHQYDTKIWVDVYPIAKHVREADFSYVVFLLLVVKTVLLSIFLIGAGPLADSLFILIFGTVFSYWYGYKIVHRKRKGI